MNEKISKYFIFYTKPIKLKRFYSFKEIFNFFLLLRKYIGQLFKEKR